MNTILLQESNPPSSAALFTDQTASQPTAQQVVLQTAMGYMASACLNVAVSLEIPDLIGDDAVDVAVLALLAGAEETYLFRILRVLEMQGIVSRSSPRSFGLTEAGQLLRRGTAGSLAAAVEWIADPLHFHIYAHLGRSVESATTTFDKIYGEPFFKWLSRPQNAAEAAVFNNAMTSFSEMCIPALLAAFDFGIFSTVVDVGGGHGALLRGILKRHPELSGIIAEMPTLLPAARAAIASDGLSGRCQAVECNFFEAVPAGGDAYLMKHIIHDWADAPARQILGHIRAVIPPHGYLLLAETVIDDSPAPHPGKLLDIEMMAFVGGKERTAGEFRHLLASAGFVLRKIVRTNSPLCLLVAEPF